MSLPPVPDPSTVYIGTATSQGSASPFVRVVWFTPQTADCVTGRGTGAHCSAVEQLHDKWLELGEPLRNSHTTQPAGGVYTELGVGLLAGTGRKSLHIAGKGTHIPYPRNPTLSENLEPALSNFMSDVSQVLHATLPRSVLHQHAAQLGWPCEATRAYQYPRLRDGTPPLHSHQVVIRGPRRVLLHNPTTPTDSPEMDEMDRSAYLSVYRIYMLTHGMVVV